MFHQSSLARRCLSFKIQILLIPASNVSRELSIIFQC